MRIILAGLAALTVVTMVDVQPVNAQERPYCMRGGTYGPGSFDCSYYTMQQCLAASSGVGGTCGPNPFLEFQRREKRSAPRRQRSNENWGWGWN